MMPNPNEVMDVEEVSFRDTLNSAIRVPLTDPTVYPVLTRSLEPKVVDEIVKLHLEAVAQQNAALLREIKSKGARLMITDVEHIVIPMDVFDAKLKEITEEEKI